MPPSPEELAALKRTIFEKLKPRRRKFIEKIGYDAWDPFQEPHGGTRRQQGHLRAQRGHQELASHHAVSIKISPHPSPQPPQNPTPSDATPGG